MRLVGGLGGWLVGFLPAPAYLYKREQSRKVLELETRLESQLCQ